MPRNVEIKVRLADLAAARAAVARLGARLDGTDTQVDRYYTLDGGRRVKLRTFGRGGAELITYDRPEVAGVRTSAYEITPVRDDAAGVCLVPKGEPLVVVRKRREVHLLDNVRIHLDSVDGLGTFLELEAVVDAAHEERACARQIDEICRALGVDPASALRASYAELLRAVDTPR
jgi:predicted adenylyl cyclase CyaB